MKYEPRRNFFQAYFQIMKAHKDYVKDRVKQYGLSAVEIEILIFLVNNQSTENTSKDISVYRGVSKGLVSKGVAALQKKGLIDLKPHATDGRAVILRLANAENEVVQDIKRITDEFKQGITENVSGEEMETLIKVNHKMLENALNIEKAGGQEKRRVNGD